jgi:hypothetical protein
MKTTTTPCRVSISVDSSPISLFPSHVVHPRDGKPRPFDTYGRAVYPDCRSFWQHTMRGKTVVLATTE